MLRVEIYINKDLQYVTNMEKEQVSKFIAMRTSQLGEKYPIESIEVKTKNF